MIRDVGGSSFGPVFRELGHILAKKREDLPALELCGAYLEAVDTEEIPLHPDLYRAVFWHARQVIRVYRGKPGYRDVINNIWMLDQILQDMLDVEARMPTLRHFNWRTGQRPARSLAV